MENLNQLETEEFSSLRVQSTQNRVQSLLAAADELAANMSTPLTLEEVRAGIELGRR